MNGPAAPTNSGRHAPPCSPAVPGLHGGSLASVALPLTALLACAAIAPACSPLRSVAPASDGPQTAANAPADHPSPSRALSSADPVERAAAVRELANRPEAWNAQAIALLDDEHPRVRIGALEALPPGLAAAEEYLLARLDDPDLGVRLAAIAAAGRAGLPAAEGRLRELAAARGEAVRAAAVAALITAGDGPIVRSGADDKAWQVRVEAARGLGLLPDDQRLPLARGLLQDPVPAVRLATVQAAADWPASLAVPLWLAALEPGPRASRADRLEAARLLAERWPPAAELSATALLNDRSPKHAEARATLAALQRRWQRERGDPFEALLGPTEPPGAAASGVHPDPRLVDQAAEALALLASAQPSPRQQEAAWQRLSALGEGLEPAVAAVAARGNVELPERLFLELLPRRAPVYADLAQLTADDVATRRAAATRLLHHAQEAPLSALAAGRLIDVTLRSADPLVWQAALQIVAAVRGEAALRLALAGAGHPEGIVREAACKLLGELGAASAAPVLRTALDDRDQQVGEAAAVALGRCGGPQDAPRLLAGLQSARPEMRLAAAEGLARLGDEAGPAALERLALDDRAAVRLRAAEAMGRLADPQFVPALLARLEDQPAVRRAALASLRALAPDRAAEIAAAGRRQLTEADEIGAWRAWAAEGRR